MDIWGEGDEENYRSPSSECAHQILLDCDRGPRSAIYYHIVEPSPGGYRYFNYWIFYRYNDFPVVGSHEGDWEDVSIAAAKTGSGLDTFDFATFSQHGHHYNYLRDNLSCDEGSKGTCGTEANRGGKRVRVYVAAGSHANYAEPCTGVCTQTNSLLPETEHDGEAPWGRNFDDPADSLLKFASARPSETDTWLTGEQNFVDWPGTWGTINSPGNQGAAFWRPWEGTGCADDDDCAVVSSTSRRVRTASCGAWLGGGVSAVVCDPNTLRRALRKGTLGGRGRFSIASKPTARTSASARGIAQAMGGGLKGRQTLKLRGAPPRRGVLLVKVRYRKRAYAARFELHTRVRGTATIRVTPPSAGARASSGSPPRVSLKHGAGRRLRPASVYPAPR